ncbi:uncharacterized protein EAF01_005553 [Botrytis porri]|uniref:uncharacterized protein n=1 Tax=Botrytis porri TaxID=87229 RepID=UPI0019016C58|nr:uncharacterized protein EAF01_005553 [Botrytis porri]KAF7905032.1 hypothetical protein EAF01_005553 [Botrytis porri]
MSIRSAAGSRAGSRASRRPVSVHHAVAPRPPSSASFISSRSRPESIHLGPIDVESDSHGARLSDGGSKIREEHRSTGPRTSTHHLPHDVFERISSHMQHLEDNLAHTRQEWGDGEIDPDDMLSRIANYRRGLDMVASPDACRNPSLKLRFDGVDDTLKELEEEANARKTRQEEGMEMTRKVAERRENGKREELERNQFLMQQKAEKERIRSEKEAKKREKAEEEKQRRILQEKKRKEQSIRAAAAFKERERLAKLEKERKEEERIEEEKNAFETRKKREKAARDRDMQRKIADKQARKAEEEARYQKKFTEEETRYVAKKTHQKMAKAELSGREEESRKRARERAVAFAKKVKDDRGKKLERKLEKLEKEISDVEEKLNHVADD